QVAPAELADCAEGKRAASRGAGFCAVATATRDTGGVLDATVAQLPPARSGLRGVVPARLGGVISASDVPLGLIDQLLGKAGAGRLGGLASITLHLQGPPSAPQATGAIQILRSWLAGGFLGDAQIAVDSTTVRGVAGLKFSGSALAGRLAITGSLGTQAPY